MDKQAKKQETVTRAKKQGTTSRAKKQETGELLTKRETGGNLKMYKNQDQHPDFFQRLFGNEFFHNFFDGDVPAINVKENKNALMLEMSVPGYSKKDFHIHVNRNVLTISGRKMMEKEEKDKDSRILKQEFSSSSFSRSFTLPEHIDTTNIGATQKDGILKITLPKLETAIEDKTKRIEIK